MAVLTGTGETRRRVSPAAHLFRASGHAALVALCIVVSACGTRGKDQTSVIRRRLDGEPKTLNPILMTSDVEFVVGALLSRNLLDYDEKLNLVPGLAEEVSDSADHRVFTIRLRPDARWEDGTPVTSADVVFTLNAIMDPKVPALNRRPLFEGLVKAEALDARTARVTFRNASAGRRDAFNLPLLSAAAWKDGDVATHPRNRRPLSDGPYRLGAWDAGRSLSLVRNTQYAGPPAPAEQVVFRVVPETAPAFAGLLSGDLDEMRLTFAQKKEIDAKAGTPGAPRAVTFDELAYAYFGWNNRSPLFSDRRRPPRAHDAGRPREHRPQPLRGPREARERAAAARPLGLGRLDRAVALRPEGGRGPPGRGRLREGSRRGPPQGPAALRVHVLARQRQRPAAADGRAGPAVVSQAGIDMKIQQLEWAAFAAKVDAGELEAWAAAWNLDPNPDLGVQWRSTQFPRTGSTTVSTGIPTSTRFSTVSRRPSTATRPAGSSPTSSGSSMKTSPCRS